MITNITNKAFSKIWIVTAVAVFAVAGIFYAQYLNKQKEIENSQETIKDLEVETEEKQGVYSGERQRDARRKADIRQIVTALDMFYVDIEAYAQIGGTATMPSSIGESLIGESIMAEVSKDPVSGENYIWIDNTKDSSKFCIYAKLEQGGYYAGSEKGTKILDFPPKDLSCW